MIAPSDRAKLIEMLSDETSKQPVGGWNLWLAYGVHADVAELYPKQMDAFLGKNWRAWFGYALSHRLLAYRFLSDLHPSTAKRIALRSRQRSALLAMAIESTFDFSLSDLYLERVAFMLDPALPTPYFSARWIERILGDQRRDGGWARVRSHKCAVLWTFFLQCDRGSSKGHPTLLAAVALSRYKARLERQGR